MAKTGCQVPGCTRRPRLCAEHARAVDRAVSEGEASIAVLRAQFDLWLQRTLSETGVPDNTQSNADPGGCSGRCSSPATAPRWESS